MAAAVVDVVVNLAAAAASATSVPDAFLVRHPEATKHALALSNLAVSHEHDVVVVDVEDEPGVLADLARRVAKAGVDLDFVYVATNNQVASAPRRASPSRPPSGSPPASELTASVDRRDRLQRAARAASAKSSPAEA